MAKAKARQAGRTALMTDIASLVIRLVFGTLMITNHGWPKLMKLAGPGPVEFGDPIGMGTVPSIILAVFAEVLCALFVVLGLFTRFAVIPLIVTMLVAVLIVHAGDPLGKLEMGILYLAAFVSIGLTGPGKYSLDNWLLK